MKNTTKTLIASVVALTFASAAHASDFKWANVYADYYKHDRAENKGEEKVIGVEGGLTTEKNDMYGFAEYSTTKDATFVKGSNHFKVLPGDFTVYSQIENFSNEFGGETVKVAGIGYTGIGGETWAFKPFVGYASKSGSFAGDDTTMVGWASFWNVSGVTLTNWTEVQLGDAPASVNGAFGAFVDVYKNVYTGVQYTYSYKAVGERDLGNSVGLRIGAHF